MKTASTNGFPDPGSAVHTGFQPMTFCRILKLHSLPRNLCVHAGRCEDVASSAATLDFALQCTVPWIQMHWCKRNHKLVPISHKLRSDDQVEIITSADRVLPMTG